MGVGSVCWEQVGAPSWTAGMTSVVVLTDISSSVSCGNIMWCRATLHCQ